MFYTLSRSIVVGLCHWYIQLLIVHIIPAEAQIQDDMINVEAHIVCMQLMQGIERQLQEVHGISLTQLHNWRSARNIKVNVIMLY